MCAFYLLVCLTHKIDFINFADQFSYHHCVYFVVRSKYFGKFKVSLISVKLIVKINLFLRKYILKIYILNN